MSKKRKTFTLRREPSQLPLLAFLLMFPEARLRELAKQLAVPIKKMKRDTANEIACALLHSGAEIEITIRETR